VHSLELGESELTTCALELEPQVRELTARPCSLASSCSNSVTLQRQQQHTSITTLRAPPHPHHSHRLLEPLRSSRSHLSSRKCARSPAGRLQGSRKLTELYIQASSTCDHPSGAHRPAQSPARRVDSSRGQLSRTQADGRPRQDLGQDWKVPKECRSSTSHPSRLVRTRRSAPTERRWRAGEGKGGELGRWKGSCTTRSSHHSSQCQRW
jgi:hypothetical protein